jgi:DNA modification methylase
MSCFTLYNMDVLKALQQIKPESVDCVITSPPYWGLRDYGVEGQIGLEEHPKQWIEKMVEVSRGLRRVLKPSGSFWLNVGDTYYGSASGKGAVVNQETISAGSGQDLGMPKKSIRTGNFDGGWMQPKQKMLMPHRLAIALQDDGWVLRNDVVWHKPSHMPSSVKDRLTNSFEYVFHFVIQKKYYYDLDAIREPHKTDAVNKIRDRSIEDYNVSYPGGHFSRGERSEGHPSGKNPADVWKDLKKNVYGDDDKTSRRSRTVMNLFGGVNTHKFGKNPGDFWAINPKPYPEAHFACYPPALVERPLKATCPKQICVKCGKARERITKPTDEYEKLLVSQRGTEAYSSKRRKEADKIGNAITDTNKQARASYETVGFSDCGCGVGFRPGVVLDPFVGSGTT